MSLHPSFRTGMPREVYDHWVQAGLLAGSPQQIIDGILAQHELLGSERFVAQFDPGMPEAAADANLELYLTEVLPVIKAETVSEDRASSGVTA